MTDINFPYVYTPPQGGEAGYFSTSAITPETTQFTWTETPLGTIFYPNVGANVTETAKENIADVFEKSEQISLYYGGIAILGLALLWMNKDRLKF